MSLSALVVSIATPNRRWDTPKYGKHLGACLVASIARENGALSIALLRHPQVGGYTFGARSRILDAHKKGIATSAATRDPPASAVVLLFDQR